MPRRLRSRIVNDNTTKNPKVSSNVGSHCDNIKSTTSSNKKVAKLKKGTLQESPAKSDENNAQSPPILQANSEVTLKQDLETLNTSSPKTTDIDKLSTVTAEIMTNNSDSVAMQPSPKTLAEDKDRSVFEPEKTNENNTGDTKSDADPIKSALEHSKAKDSDVAGPISASCEPSDESQSAIEMAPPKKKELTAAQKARIERNRQKALLLRQSRLSQQQLQGTKHTASCSKIVDTGGGFFLEENQEDAAPKKKITRVEEPAPVIAGCDCFCLECDKPFQVSYLYTTYDHPVCDGCRDPSDAHSVITKTEARETYLLNEADITKREPLLKFVVRKNPHNKRWGDMKLFLRLQIEERALEIWETPEALEAEHEAREQKREEAKKKKFQRNMKKLRQEVRSSLYQMETKSHEHSFGPDKPLDGAEDTYVKTCADCGHQVTFEKM